MNVSPAGVYDFALGGTQNTEADRLMVERAKQVMPHILLGAWANRGFLQRAVSRLAGECGITQFIDLGSGFPTQRNTHEVVAERRPEARVVYVDVDPRVVAKSQELLADSDRVTAVQADVRDPQAILRNPAVLRVIDFEKPVAILLVAVTHFLSDEDNPWRIVDELMAGVPSGSYLALSAVTSDRQEETWDQVLQGDSRYEGFPRTRAEVERFFTGLDIVPPYDGAKPEVAYIGLWGAEDPDLADDDGSRLAYAAVARKP